MNDSINPEIESKIKDWKDKLTDKSRNNPLLDSQKTRKPKLDFLEEAVKLFNQLIVRDSTFRLKELKIKEPENESKIIDKLCREAKATLEEKGFHSLFLVLGTLTWFDTKDPENQKDKDKFLSPLLLIPVELKKEVKKPPQYTLSVAGEDIYVNFILVNELSQFKITLPESDKIEELGYEKFIDEVRKAIADKHDWTIEENAAYISLFASNKSAMIKDIEENQELIANHPILKGLILREKLEDQNIQDIKPEKLDFIKPESVYQISDADSSQQKVIEAAKAGSSFVVESLPGTGKSQTITNIIVELIAQKKKVLLVAEKQTALNVVYDNLQKPQPSLKDLCLNLHHQGTNKPKEFLEELNKTKIELSQRIDSGFQEEEFNIDLQKLEHYRLFLNNYTTSLHQKHQPINKSAFDLYGELLKLEREEVPNFEFTIDHQNWSNQELSKAEILLNKLKQFERIFKGIETTIWLDSPVTEWSSEVERSLEDNIDNLDKGLQSAIKINNNLPNLFKINYGNHLSGLDKLQLGMQHIINLQQNCFLSICLQEREVDNLQNILYNMEKDIDYIINIQNNLNNKYIDEFLTSDLSKFQENMENIQTYPVIFSWLKFLNYDYWITRNAIINFRKVKKRVSDQEIIEDINIAIKYQQIFKKLNNDINSDYYHYFNSFTNIEMTDILEVLKNALTWLKDMQTYQLNHLEIKNIISSPESFKKFNILSTDLKKYRNLLKEGFQFLKQHFPDYITSNDKLEKTSLEELIKFVSQAKNELNLFQQSLDCWKLMNVLEALGAKDFLEKLRNSNISSDFWFSVLKKGVYENYLKSIKSDSYELRTFKTENYEQTIKEFYNLDIKQHEIAVHRLQQIHTNRWNNWSKEPEADKQIQLFKKSQNSKGKNKKIRQLLKYFPELVTALKPFWLMSPLAVSQFIDMGIIEFDVVIFDEASQICTEDAVPAIMRAKQVIIVGDSQQLPPTFFGKSSTLSDEDEETEEYESLLEESLTCLPSFTLKWHYRSNDESLIAFSNQKFYNSQLLTFPNPFKNPDLGVHFHYVKNGIYNPGDGRRNNMPEAETVAKLALNHFQQHPKMSLGIVTLNETQAETIREEIQKLNSEIEELSQENSHNFFIKPLEQVQGDQQEVIIFSFGFGFPENGNPLTYNFVSYKVRRKTTV